MSSASRMSRTAKFWVMLKRYRIGYCCDAAWSWSDFFYSFFCAQLITSMESLSCLRQKVAEEIGSDAFTFIKVQTGAPIKRTKEDLTGPLKVFTKVL